MNRIKELRLAHKMKQSELAEKIGVSQAALSGYESGDHEPGKAILVKIATTLGTTTDYLLGHSDMKKAPTSEEMDALTPKQRRIIELMGQMTPEQQDELVRQAQYQLWLKQQDKSDP